MATVTTTRLVDDLDGTDAAETVSLALDGVSYEIDLSSEHAGELREVLSRFVSHARRTGGRVQRGRPAVPEKASSGGTQAEQRAHTKAVRVWAKANGFMVSARGRIPVRVLEAYGNRGVQEKVIMKEKVSENPEPKAGTVARLRAVPAKTNVSRGRSTSRRSGQDSKQD